VEETIETIREVEREIRVALFAAGASRPEDLINKITEI
jgi:hypothetical protein